MIEAARECIGTRWHHQGRLKGVGMDCLGLLVHCGKAAGLSVCEETVYERRADAVRFQQTVDMLGMERVPIERIELADFLFFVICNRPQHCGIVSSTSAEGSFVHIPVTGDAVCIEEPLSPYWRQIIHSVWRARELSEEI